MAVIQRVGSPAKPRKWMSVHEMGDMLGLKKTDRYWLVHKNYFRTETLLGKMRVEIASFEKWYANQDWYHKVNGEAPGKELRLRSYSPKEIQEMLGTDNATVYEILKKNNIETVTVNERLRVPTDAFWDWYHSQSRYRTQEDRKKDAAAEAASLSMPEMARLLDVPRSTVYGILSSKKYAPLLDVIVIAGRRRVTRESFERYVPDEPIRPLVLAHHIKAAAECSAGSQDPKNLPIGGFLVWKSMKAVQRQNDVEGVVCIGECSHISLPEGYIFQLQVLRLFLRLPHHIGRIIETGNVRLRHSLINRHGQNPCSHRYFQQLAGEMLRNTGHCLFQIGVVFRLVHCPHQAAHRFPTQSRAGDHAVIKTVSARHSVRTANGFFSFHGSSSVFQSSHDRFQSHFFKMSTIFAKSSFASLKIGSIQ